MINPNDPYIKADPMTVSLFMAQQQLGEIAGETFDALKAVFELASLNPGCSTCREIVAIARKVRDIDDTYDGDED